MIASLFKRSSIYLGLSMLSKFASIAAFVIFARVLLPQQFGVLVLYSTLGQIAVLLGDFGLVQWYQKKSHSQNQSVLFSELINARVFTLTILLIVAFIFFTFVPTFPSHIVILFLATMIPDSFFSVVDGVFFSQKKSFKVSAKIGVRMSLLLFGFLLFKESASFELVAYLYLIATILALIWYFPWKLLKFVKPISVSEMFKVLKSSFSYAFLVFTSYAYARGDSVIIGYSLGNTALGLYGAAYRYLEGLSLLPTALAQNLFPEATKEGNVSLKQLKKMTLIMFGLGVIVSLFLYFNSQLLIVAILGETYLQAVPLLKIFSMVVLLFFVSSPLNTVVISSRLVSKFLPYGIANTALNIILNIIFIPIFGVIAAAWIMFLSEISGLFLNLVFVKKIYSK